MKRISLSIIIVNLLVIGCAAHTSSSELNGDSQQRAEIRLDTRPLTDPTSTFVVLREDGRAQVVRYTPYGLTIENIYCGELSQTEASRLFAQIGEPRVREALSHRDSSLEGISEGSPFFLSLRRKGAVEDYSGMVEATPDDIKTLIEKISTLWKRLSETAPAEAYLKSQHIPQQQYELLQRAGKTRFLSLQDFPASLRHIIDASVTPHRDFQALNRAQYDQFQGLRSSNDQLFVATAHGSYQLTFYLPRNTSTLNKGEPQCPPLSQPRE